MAALNKLSHPDPSLACQLTEESSISCSNFWWTALWKTVVSYRSSPNWPLRAASAVPNWRNITRSGLGSPTSGLLHQSTLKPWKWRQNIRCSSCAAIKQVDGCRVRWQTTLTGLALVKATPEKAYLSITRVVPCSSFFFINGLWSQFIHEDENSSGLPQANLPG